MLPLICFGTCRVVGCEIRLQHLLIRIIRVTAVTAAASGRSISDRLRRRREYLDSHEHYIYRCIVLAR